MRLEILVEEPSMENLLRIILPNILPESYRIDENCFIRAHQGKQDLKKSIPIKIRAFSRIEDTKFIILHDQDSNDCKVLKRDLLELCSEARDRVLVRIVCKELEAWYIGDMNAIEKVYPRFKAENNSRKSKFRNPDILSAADELEKNIHEFSKGYASKNIPKYMDIENNISESFNQFISGVKRFLGNN